ncbi:hypothetical protein Tco_0691100 [Tanacetum coccineum]
MSNRHQELASPKQTALYCTKALATPEQKTTGKEIPNPFIADGLLKTIRSDEMLLKIKSQKMDSSNLISAPNPTKVKTGTRPCAAIEVPLLTATTNRVIDMDTTGASRSSGTPSTVEKSLLDFADEDLPPPNNEAVGTKEQTQKEPSQEIPLPAHSTHGWKSLAAMGLGAGLISSTPSTQGAPTPVKSVSDPDPLSYVKPQLYSEQDIAQSSRGTATEIPTEHVATTEVNVQLSVGSPESRKSTFVPSVVRSPGGIYQPDWGVTSDCRLDTPDACQDMVDHIVPPRCFSELRPFFCRTGKYPSRILSRCSTTDRGTPVMSDGCHANISNFSFRGEHTSLSISLDDVVTVAHSAGIKIVLQIVTIPPSTGNLSIPWAVDSNAYISFISGLPMMPLYGDSDLMIMKFIHAFVA